MDVTRERISRILELREILLSLQTGFNLVHAAVARAILKNISGLEPSSVITEPRYLKLVTVSSSCPLTLDRDRQRWVLVFQLTVPILHGQLHHQNFSPDYAYVPKF